MLIPQAFLPRIVAELARGEFINTFPGREGGLELARPSDQINLREVVEYFEGPIFVSDCMSGRTQCPFDTKCPVRCRWGKLQATIIHELESITFDELAQDALEADIISLPIFNYLSLERKIAHRKCAIEQNLKNRKANTNYGLATRDLNAFLLLKITG